MYDVIIGKRVRKKIKKLPSDYQKKIIEAIYNLSNDPRPKGYKKITNYEAYRIRVGDYRVIYEIIDKQLVVSVVDLDHRKDIYRK